MLLRVLLWLNGLWDLACVAAMLYSARAREPWQTPHWALWERASDRANPAARALFAALVLHWGGVRLLGATRIAEDGVRLCVMWTYAVESVFLSFAAATGGMREGRALVASALCVPMLILLLLHPRA